MMMPENIELRIKDMTTLSECIEEAKVCLSICQPSSLVSQMSTLTVAPSETNTPIGQRSPSPSEEIRLILTYKIDRVEQDKDHQFSKDLHFKVLDSIQVMFDLAPCQIPEINFTNSRGRSLSRPRFGNFNQPIECYYCHRMGHTANNCFRRQNRNNSRRQPNQGKRTNYRNFKRYPNYRQDSRYRTPNPSQRRVNFSEPPMYSGFTDRESMISVDSVVPTYRQTSDPIEEVFQMQNENVIETDYSFMPSEPLDVYSRQVFHDEDIPHTVYGTDEEFNTLFYDIEQNPDNEASEQQVHNQASISKSVISTFVCTPAKYTISVSCSS